MRILILACAVMAMGGTAGAQRVATVDCRGASIAECHKGWSEATPLYNTREYGSVVLTFGNNGIIGFSTGVPGNPVSLGVAIENGSWHFVSQTYGGHISAMGGLSKEECDAMVKRTRGEPVTDEEAKGAAYLADKHKGEVCAGLAGTPACVMPYMLTMSDIRDAECYQ